MFVIFLILLAVSLPVSFSMALSTLIALKIGNYPGEVFSNMVIEGVKSYILLAIPFFILAGNLMNSTGITQRIFDFASALVGHIRGGLAQVNIMASVIFAGISGTAVGDQAGLGAVEVKAMTEKGYSRSYSASITLASSVIGAIIPPSVSLIVYAFLSEVSVARLFVAGIIPGLLIAVVLMLHVNYTVKRGLVQAPSEESFDIRSLWTTLKKGFFALLAPFIILGGILSGIVTPTEAGVLAVLYSLVVAIIYRDLTLKSIKDTLHASVKSTALIMFLIGVGTAMGWIISAERLPILMSSGLLALTENKFLMLLIINIILLLLGMVLEGIPIKLIMLPILLPIIDMLGIDRIHFGIVMSYNLLLGMITPPVGIGLYVMSSVTNVSVEKIIKDTIPFYLPLVIALILITYFPSLSLWLPNLLFK